MHTSQKDYEAFSNSAANWLTLSAKMLYQLSLQHDQPNTKQKIEKMLATHHNSWVV